MPELEKYDVLEKIGHGSFGIIRKVKRKSDGHILCRKEINYIRMSQKEREQLHAEFSILNSLRHPNIVAYYHREHIKSSQDLHLYMEYCGGGDLSQVIKRLQQKNEYAEEEFVWSIFSQLVTALFRCHYGVDPPEAGRNVMGLGNNARPVPLKGKQAQIMILHRDLKPENVFLGGDNSVKLGDFGLSKLMQSHDFASTYVGTPFYMSPEICAAEKYTLHSDIWSLGCIMYELCAKEPPFNAKTHFHLVQKIKDGRVAPLPSIYSAELQKVISSCLKTNPSQRPETAALLNLPVIKLMRKEREVVDLGNVLKTREELAVKRIAEADDRIARLDAEKESLKRELEASVRREWEVKARLEIDRQVQLELERLHKKFETEVQEKVEVEVQKQLRAVNPSNETSTEVREDIPQSSVSTSGDTDFLSTTDLSELSIESPVSNKSNPVKKGTRTPFSRSRTMYDSPMDVQMGEPSPMSIASLSLSPRRTVAAATSQGKNIFTAAAEQKLKWEPHMAYSEDEEDEVPDLPSPTRAKASNDPFKIPARPGLLRTKTAPMKKLNSQPNLFSTASSKPQSQPHMPTTTSQPNVRSTALSDKGHTSPNRRLSKIPSSSTLAIDGGSPVRKGAPKLKALKPLAGGEDMFKAVMQRNMGGRTLVELAQARAGGRPLDDGGETDDSSDTKTKKQTMGDGEIKLAARLVDRSEVVWDPERDEMPSPFLVRSGKGMRNIR
ncbi:MAG: G2-specific serine/threonine protein kinase [Pleopsidium flavum]|nr:MAG: G2-specific serine/threonine protein kinase [Pleopsidium flavum]